LQHRANHAVEAAVRPIAFYLPQFHPVPENDAWWGPGFTEWTNVVRSRPRFPGHYQPHLPADLGFYDLRLPEVREAQAALARDHGIHGFCYYHYWFGGRRILERPFDEVLASGKPDFPFCLCWANENWTRVWDGGENQVLLAQRHSPEDDRALMQGILPAFDDRRYIRVDGKPLFLVWRTRLLPDPGATAQRWREVARAEGIGELYLVRVESHDDYTDPRSIGFDAGADFEPRTVKRMFGSPLWNRLPASMLPRAYLENKLVSYGDVVAASLSRTAPDHELFRGLTPGWDNSARRTKEAKIVVGSTPEAYREWLEQLVVETRVRHDGDHRLIFINAWNEWAEGCHLEPDQRWGRAYLEATRDALASGSLAPLPDRRADGVPGETAATPVLSGAGDVPPYKLWYWNMLIELGEIGSALRYLRSSRRSQYF
jgi:lipopolysaccharide biosynthesis protein